MGIGEKSPEQGVFKRRPMLIDVADPGAAVGLDESSSISASLLIPKEGGSPKRVCAVQPGDRVYVILDGDPDEEEAEIVVAEPQVGLGPLRHPAARQIAILLRMGVAYHGEVIDVVPHPSECEFILQLTRWSSLENNEIR